MSAGLFGSLLPLPPGVSPDEIMAALPAQRRPGVTPEAAPPPQIAGLGAADLAALFQRMPLGAPQGFQGGAGSVSAPVPQVAETEADTQRLERQMGMVPPAPKPVPVAGLGNLPPASAPDDADKPMPGSVPLQGRAPLSLAPPAPGAAAPATSPVPAPAAAPAAEPSFGDRLGAGLDRFQARGGFDMLGSIGMGLLSTKGFGQGLAAGMKNYQDVSAKKAATDLAKAEFGLKQRKVVQEEAGLNANAQLIRRAFPEMTDQQAIGGASNGTLVTAAIAKLQNPNAGRDIKNDGSGVPRYTDTGKPVYEGDTGKADVQLVTRPDGSVVAVNKGQIGEAGGGPVATPILPGENKLAAEAAQRRALIVSMGKDPNDPRNADFIVSGSLPKENQQQLTAADKQAIREGEDSILTHRNALSQLNRALTLSPKAYQGATAGMRAAVMTNLPEALGGGGEAAMATREFDNLMSTQMLDSLKAIFGGNPTEGERAALKDIQGISSMPQELRDKVIKNTIAKIESRLGFEQQRVDDLRGGTYYKPGNGGAPGAQAAQAQAPTPAADPIAAAREAIAQGADANKVKTRLLKMGIDPKGL